MILFYSILFYSILLYCIIFVHHTAVLREQVGWKHGALIERLETQRKVKSEAFHKKKAAIDSDFVFGV